MSTRDIYANLLRDTRGLRREHASARDAWFASLPWERKEETLFELEMLLKGLACFANPRNHPGVPRFTPAVAHDFREELRIVRDALEQAGHLIRTLLAERDRTYTFSRYLESLLSDDAERTKLLRDQLSQDTPEESLFVLRNAFGAFQDLADGLARGGRVSHRGYHALLSTVVREIGRNQYFNPLFALEFRHEFDRIRHPSILDALHAIRSESAHRLCAMTFLALFRGLRYLDLVERYAAEASTARRAYVILAVLRSDTRALTRFLVKRAADALADGFEHELLATSVDALMLGSDELTETAQSLMSLRRTLEHIGNTLRLDVRRVLEKELPGPDVELTDEELAPKVLGASRALRESLHHAIRALGQELRPGHDLAPLDSKDAIRREVSDRLRRDIWMFLQILRAFLAKSEAAERESDDWSSISSFQFVREFLGHFRAVGYQLVRTSDYPGLDRFLASLETLRDADLLDDARMDAAFEECTAFYDYLQELFGKISQRAELKDRPFDKKSAAELLRLYLGAA